MNLKDYLKSNYMKVIVPHRSNILKRYFPMAEKTNEEFEEYGFIASWHEHRQLSYYQKNNLLSVLKRINKVLSMEYHESSIVNLFILPPRLRNSSVHSIELIMPVIRFRGFIIEDTKTLNFKDKEVTLLRLRKQKETSNVRDLLFKYKNLDFIKSYEVDRETQTMIGKMEFRIVGINKNPEAKKLVGKIIKKYPELKYGEGKRPKIVLREVDFIKGTFHDPNAIAIDVERSGKHYQIGWLSASVESKDGLNITPNEYVKRMITFDQRVKDSEKIIQSIKLHTLGSFEKDGKELMFGKILITVELGNMG